MNEVKFDMEKKGYSVEQVDSYVKLIQDNYQKAAKGAAEYEVEIEQIRKKFDEDSTDMPDSQRIEEELEVQIQNLKEMLTQKEEQIQNIIVEDEAIKGELEERRKIVKGINEEIEKKRNGIINIEDISFAKRKKELIEAINKERQNTKNLLQEKNDFQNIIGELNQRISEMETNHKETEEEKLEGSGDPFDEIMSQAKQQADAYMSTIKADCVKEREKELIKARQIMDETRQTAELLKQEARQCRTEDIDKEFEKIKRARAAIKKEKEEFLVECEYLEREAQVELKSAREEADHIVHRAKEKLEIAREKDRAVTEKTISRIKGMGENMVFESRSLHKNLEKTIEEMHNLFAVREKENNDHYMDKKVVNQ